jgi:hypothetical protein
MCSVWILTSIVHLGPAGMRGFFFGKLSEPGFEGGERFGGLICRFNYTLKIVDN